MSPPLAVALLCAAVHAQAFPAVAFPLDVTRLASAELYGDETIHGLAIANSRVQLIWEPAVHQSVFQLGTAATLTVGDLCVVKARAVGGSDVFLTVGPDGLDLTVMQHHVTDPATAPATSHLASDAWVGARRVVGRLCPLPSPPPGYPDAVLQIAGLSGDGKTLLTGTWANGVFTPGATLTFGRALRDLVLLDWDGQDLLDVGVLNGSQLQVLRFADLVQLAMFGSNTSAGFFTVLHIAATDPANPPHEQIALARQPSAQHWELVRCWMDANQQLATAPPVAVAIDGTITAFELAGIVAGDFTGDGTDDVLMVTSTLQDWEVVPLLGNLPAQSVTMRSTTSPPPMLCLPAVADFDHDGLADALMSLQELHEIQVKSRIYNAAPPPSDPPDILPDLGEWASAGSTLELDLVNLPAVAVYDTIEVTVWTEHFAGDDPQGIDPAGSLHTFPNVDGGTTHVSIPLQMWSSFGDSTGPLWDPKLESWGRIRLLKTNDAGHIVASSRDYLFDLGMPQVPDLVLDYPPQPNTLLWASVTRFGSDRSFGCRYLRSSSGRRIWTAVNIPHGIPPVAPGSGTMPDG